MVYLDYASTNPWPKYRCSDYYEDVYKERFHIFNPNANYAFAEKQALEKCEERIKMAIGAKGGKVVFGGTASQLIENLMNCDGFSNEANLWTIGSAYEHDSVDRFLTNNNLKTLDDLERKLSTFKKWDKPIVFWQGVNNVTGRVFDIEKIGKLCHKYVAFFLCDATALVGHAPIPKDIDEWCSAFWYSGHKIGTELGIGAMWLSKEFNDWLGDFKLYGTPNVAGALAIADATEDVVKNAPNNELHCYGLRKELANELNANKIESSILYGKSNITEHSSAINAIRLNGINARALQSYLASKQVYIGLGQSSCSEENDNRILNSFGLSDEEANEVIRISFGENSTTNDVISLVTEIKNFIKEYVK